MSSQAIGQRFMVSRGGCWQCGSDCRSQLAEVLTFSSVAYNGQGLQQYAMREGLCFGAYCCNPVLCGVIFKH